MDFAELLRHLRAERGCSLATLAVDAGLSRSHLSNLEHGRRAPSPEMTAALAKAFGLTGSEESTFVISAGLAHVPELLRGTLRQALREPGQRRR